jgi:hypothetical protein
MVIHSMTLLATGRIDGMSAGRLVDQATGGTTDVGGLGAAKLVRIEPFTTRRFRR